MRRVGAFSVALVLLAVSPIAVAATGPACLGPGVGHVLEALAADPSFEARAPSGYRLMRLDVQRDHVELGYDDATGPAATLVLSVADRDPRRDDRTERGKHFDHHVEDLRGSLAEAARVAMLDAAMAVDRAIPDAEVRNCDSTGSDGSRAPAAFGIGMGLLQVAIVLAAIFLGFAPPRKPSRGT